MYTFIVWSRLAACPFKVQITVEVISTEAILEALAARLGAGYMRDAALRGAVCRTFKRMKIQARYKCLDDFALDYARQTGAGEKIDFDQIVFDDCEAATVPAALTAQAVPGAPEGASRPHSNSNSMETTQAGPSVSAPYLYTFDIVYRSSPDGPDIRHTLGQYSRLPWFRLIHKAMMRTIRHAIGRSSQGYAGAYEQSTGLSLVEWLALEERQGRTIPTRVELTVKGLEPVEPYVDPTSEAFAASSSLHDGISRPGAKDSEDTVDCSPAIPSTPASTASLTESGNDSHEPESQVRTPVSSSNDGVGQGSDDEYIVSDDPSSSQGSTSDSCSGSEEENGSGASDGDPQAQGDSHTEPPAANASAPAHEIESGRYGVPGTAPRRLRRQRPPRLYTAKEVQDDQLLLRRVETCTYLFELEQQEGHTPASMRLLRIIGEEDIAPVSQLGLKLLDLVKALKVNGELCLGPPSPQVSAQEIAAAAVQPVQQRLDQFAEMLDHIAYKVGVNVVEPDVNGNTPAISPRLTPHLAPVDDDPPAIKYEQESDIDDNGESGSAEAAVHDGSAPVSSHPLGLRSGIELNEAQRALLGMLASPEQQANELFDTADTPGEIHQEDHLLEDPIGLTAEERHLEMSPRQKLDKVLDAAYGLQDSAPGGPADPHPAPPAPTAPPVATYPRVYHPHHPPHAQQPREPWTYDQPAFPPSTHQYMPTSPYTHQYNYGQPAPHAGMPPSHATWTQPYAHHPTIHGAIAPYGDYHHPAYPAYSSYGHSFAHPNPPSSATTESDPSGDGAWSNMTECGSNFDRPTNPHALRPAYPYLRHLVPPFAGNVHGW